MDLINAQNTFARRLYDWSLSDFRREINEGFPLLSSVGLNNRSVAAFVDWIREMHPDQQRILTRVLVWRAHKNAANLRGERMSKAEAESWNEEFYTEITTRMHRFPPLRTADRTLPTFKPVDTAECLKLLFSLLSPALGKPVCKKSGVFAAKMLGDWKIISEFTFDRGDTTLSLEYQFIRKDGRPIIGHDSPFPRNPFWFYGVTHTGVSVPSLADSEPMAKAMAKLAEHFVAHADPLFSGLGIND